MLRTEIEHFAGDGDAFLARGFGDGARDMRSRIESGTETRSSFFMNSALRALTSGQIPAMTGMRQCSILRRKFSSSERSKTGCVTANSAPASTLYSKRRDFFVDVGHAGVGADSDGEAGPGADRVATNVEAAIQVVHNVDQADGVHVENRGGVGIAAHLREDRR